MKETTAPMAPPSDDKKSPDSGTTPTIRRRRYSVKTTKEEKSPSPTEAAPPAAPAAPETPALQLEKEQVLGYLVTVFQDALRNQQYTPALRAVELMGKHLGMFEKNDHGDGMTLVDALRMLGDVRG